MNTYSSRSQITIIIDGCGVIMVVTEVTLICRVEWDLHFFLILTKLSL